MMSQSGCVGGNVWNSGNIADIGEKPKKNNCDKNGGNRFQMKQQEINASLQRHLQQDYDSSSEEEELDSKPILSSVLKEYSQLNKSEEAVGKIHEFIENSFQVGAVVCLICISVIKRIDPIWNCLECYGHFHLVCIQKWANDKIHQLKQAQVDLPNFKKIYKFNWPCPKCRHEYEEHKVPQKYYCFCGGVQDPVYQQYLVPHSCGEKCNKALQPDCGHSCLLLCHPGPCPPCPKTVQIQCHCKKEGPMLKRCNNKLWSCGTKCGKPLLCKKHVCESNCHPGDCPPCDKVSVQNCECGTQSRKQPCMTPNWQCDKVCGKSFSCGFHSCSIVCHSGSCGECPRSLIRTCPCGKTEYQLSCTKEIPTCNETCGKMLECGVHYCFQKCHKDKCGMCLENVKKVCRCGQYKKDLPCVKEFLCGSKCKRRRNCARHPCSRKCCDMNCPPCEKQCERTLSCGNHKCSSVCHKGQCYPCPETVKISCRCGSTQLTVPCGREKKTKPPKCNKLCLNPPDCHHAARDEHKCHFGKCPPCSQICGKERKTCQHKCSAQCHDSVWREINANPAPTGPWEAHIKMKRCNLPCPDCEVPVPVTCVGGHKTTSLPCFKAKPFFCENPCGRLLQCGNHKCDKSCHEVLDASDSLHAGKNCSECNFKCEKKRPNGCTHNCLSPCHPGDCPPCKVSLKKKCHCNVSILYISCSDFSADDEESRKKVLSCGNPCPRKYPCGHSCISNCHTGECPEPEMCREKVKLSCRCGNFKKLVSCELVRKENVKILDCNEHCSVKATQKKKASLEKKRNREEMKKIEMIKSEGIEETGNGIELKGSFIENFINSNYQSIVVSAVVASVTVAIIYLLQ